MNEVRAKKYLGQHFLCDENIAQRIVDSLSPDTTNLLEIGPGMGVLTKYLIARERYNFHVIEIDHESVEYLHQHFPTLKVTEGDFLKYELSTLFNGHFSIIGNFPYNISSQILFKVYHNHDVVDEVVGMFQKEVAERIAAGPGNKTYGILSVLLHAFYHIEYLFTVHENVFNPPPKVKSAVIRLSRNNITNLECDEQLFVKIVKAGFNQRRKTLRNALRSAQIPTECLLPETLNKRAEQLSVNDYIEITKTIESCL